MTKRALVMGATGGIGGETARALLAHGWQVRGLARRAQATTDGIEWRLGDALDGAAVLAAAEGASVIVHAVNPPGYRDWDKLVLPMLDSSLAAARANHARLVLPGTIYNFDPRDTPVAREESPQQPNTRKGAIRVAMERRIEISGVRALILRAGDYFGPRGGNGWLTQAVVTPGKPVEKLTMPGTKGVGHAWAYLPDVAETFARLLDAEDRLPDFARFHFNGYWDEDGAGMARAIGRVIGRPDLPERALPWALLPLIAPFNRTMRELIEMRPFWTHPVRLDNRALVGFLGEEPHTPIDQALRTTLAAIGCLEPVAA